MFLSFPIQIWSFMVRCRSRSKARVSTIHLSEKEHTKILNIPPRTHPADINSRRYRVSVAASSIPSYLAGPCLHATLKQRDDFLSRCSEDFERYHGLPDQCVFDHCGRIERIGIVLSQVKCFQLNRIHVAANDRRPVPPRQPGHHPPERPALVLTVFIRCMCDFIQIILVVLSGKNIIVVYGCGQVPVVPGFDIAEIE